MKLMGRRTPSAHPCFRAIGGVIFAILVIVAVAACSQGDSSVELPETPVLSGRDRYVLAVEPYVRVYTGPERTSAIVTHLRRGDVLAVESRTPDERWIEVRQLSLQGWIEREGVRSFSSREQAINARSLLDP